MSDLKSMQWVSEDTIEIHLGDPVASETLEKVERLSRWIKATPLPWLVDYCYGFGLLNLVVRPDLISVIQLNQTLHDLLEPTSESSSQTELDLIEIAVCYDPAFGIDLKSISERTHLSIDAVVEAHHSRDYRVLATGFVPGFAYLGETDPRLHLPRLDVPRTRIPVGSVAIAENQTVIYPKQTPGGWHIIGRIPGSIVSFTNQSIHAQLSMGKSVRFRPISLAEFQRLEAAHAPG
ncbi:MAG: allophanate hydrolase subunit 1 [Litorivicinaceae bacterium]|nr:MAG: allophanate hydrolase subunit 1 [Litorivicinaceae bacterium]